ncbi:MAG: hypothetical protein R3B72_03700 [Polyangiaceae bacterium]
MSDEKKGQETDQYFAVEVPHGNTQRDKGMSYLRMGNLPGENESPSNLEPGDADIIKAHAILSEEPTWSDQMHHRFLTEAATGLRDGDGQAPHQNEDDFLEDLGWRDHCHGNRISTTFGDKVEVITGNYKLVVMGGNEDPTKSTGLDMSGGHTVNWAWTPGCIKRIENVKADGGEWRVTWSTEKGNEVHVYEGKIYEHHVGGTTHYTCSYVGKSNPEMEDGDGRVKLVRGTAYSELIISEELGEQIFSVSAGSTPAEFSEDEMFEPPPADAGAADAHGYGKSDLIHDITFAKKKNETVRADEVVVDYQATSTTEKCTGAYAGEFYGPSRKNFTATTFEERDTHLCVGNIFSEYASLAREDLSQHAEYFSFALSGSRQTIASTATLDANVRTAGVYMGDLQMSPVISSIRTGALISSIDIGAVGFNVAPPLKLNIEGVSLTSNIIDIDTQDVLMALPKILALFL